MLENGPEIFPHVPEPAPSQLPVRRTIAPIGAKSADGKIPVFNFPA
jgi:hypothetical protein